MIKKFCSCMLSVVFCLGGNAVFCTGKNVSKFDKSVKNTPSVKATSKNKTKIKTNTKNKKCQTSVYNETNINENSKENINKKKGFSLEESFHEIWDKIYENRGSVALGVDGCLDLLSSYLIVRNYKGKNWTKFLEHIDELTKFLDYNNVLFRENDFNMYLTNCYVRTEGLLDCLDENTRNNIDNDFKMKILITLVRIGFSKLVDELFRLNVYDQHSFAHFCKALSVTGDDMAKQNVIKDGSGKKIHVVLSKEDIEQEIECAETYIEKINDKFENMLFSDLEQHIELLLEDENYSQAIENFRFELLTVLKSDDEISRWVKNNLEVYK